ncbi:MIP/aquaporin family protein [Streptomyces sp. NBC_01497]|uniref:MIP/aquaporin family protein n=1 Tax=Streptomyces sp. NBC_01497 TaxID=2903885 RepID=UPI002E2F047F|nr:aquaporin [Streptomyces sp. NBC_01497]
MSDKAPNRPAPLPLARAADEFVLTTVLLFVGVSVVRWVLDPSSPLFIARIHVAIAVVGVLAGGVLTALILSPPGRRSGGHMNPAVTAALWLMDVFPGRSVPPYVLAQLGGSVAGAALARAVWGAEVGLPVVSYGVIRPSPSWHPDEVFQAETGCLIALTLVIGFSLAHPAFARYVPYAVGAFVAGVVASLGPYSGGAINPVRQFGPAVISGHTTDLWVYLLAPVLGAALGASVHHLLVRRFDTHVPLTYKLAGERRGPDDRATAP